jgi:sugar/nucleoside kinase (ribokinase family)
MAPPIHPSEAPSRQAALFVGLCRFDWIQILHGQAPLTEVRAAGGPAASAAVTFAFLGGRATLLTGVGSNMHADAIRADLRTAGVRLIDAANTEDSHPATLYLRYSADAVDRPVTHAQAASGPRLRSPLSLQAAVGESDVVLIDGQHPDLAQAAARAAREGGRTCLLDARTWHKVTPYLLPFADIAVCSADTRPRDRRRRVPKEILSFLLDHGVSWAAVTDGPRPIRWASRAHGAGPDIPVPATEEADSLGAGEAFQGALAHTIATRPVTDDDSFSTALQFAAEVAAYSCQTYGPRDWMNSWPGDKRYMQPE